MRLRVSKWRQWENLKVSMQKHSWIKETCQTFYSIAKLPLNKSASSIEYFPSSDAISSMFLTHSYTEISSSILSYHNLKWKISGIVKFYTQVIESTSAESINNVQIAKDCRPLNLSMLIIIILLTFNRIHLVLTLRSRKLPIWKRATIV